MAHAHGSHSHGGHAGNQRRLVLTLILASSYMVAEGIGGLLTNSLALLADAGHMLSDVAALALSLFAVSVASRPANAKRTYGYHRAEILAALANGATLIAISLFIFVEAFHRLYEPPEVRGGAMMAIAVGGLAVNLLCLWILGGSHSENLNVRGAWLHVLTDALGSVGAITAALLIWGWGWYWADPLTSILIGLLVIYSSWHLLSESVSVLMESAPSGIDVDQVREVMKEVPGVVEVHDLHVWSITSGMHSLSAHVVTADPQTSAGLLVQLRTLLHDRFGIDHLTLQIEPPDFEEGEVHD